MHKLLAPSNRRFAPAIAAALFGLLTACGGGGGDGPSAPDGGGGGGGAGAGIPAAVELVALGSSAHTASLAWKAVAGATGYTVERRSAGSTFAPVATLGAQTRAWLDDGLAQDTAYVYRVVPAGVAATATEQTATTSADAPVVTAVGAAQGQESGATADAAGAATLAHGAVRLSLPAGAVPAGTALALRTVSNTAPDGLGDGVAVRIAAQPSRPVTITLGWTADEDTLADGLGVAMQRGDGSWLALPVIAVDTAARTVSVELQPALAAGGAGALAKPQSARGAAADVSLEVHVVKYLNFHLTPRSSVVRTHQTRLLVPSARTRVVIGKICIEDPEYGCIPMPIVDTREIPFDNQKDGYTRRWFVEDQEGGSTALGTIVPRAGSGAVYHAPAQEPAPNPVTVAFRSTHVKTGRTLTLRASVRVKQPIWTGTIDGMLEQSADIGFAFSAQAVWTPMAGSQDSVFQATGTQSVHVIDNTCSASASPGTVALPPGALTIDRSVDPARYTLDVGSLWNTTITGTCPGHGSTSVGMLVPGRLQVEGTVGGDGTLIQGSTSMNGIFWGWSLKAE